MTTKKRTADVEALGAVLDALSSLESDLEKRWVLDAVSSRLGLAPMAQPAGAAPSLRPFAAPTANMNPKEFMRLKDPKSDVQRVACLAQYLTNFRESAQFKSVDLSALNTEAAGPRINMSRAVNNATNQNGYLASAGGGRKQITALGEDVASALPNQEGVKAVEEQSSRPKRKKRPTKKSAKK